MRSIRPRQRVAPSGWRAIRNEAHLLGHRNDAFTMSIIGLCGLLLCLCLGAFALVETVTGHFPPALQVIDDLRFNTDYRHGVPFTAAALGNNGRLFLGTAKSGLEVYRTDSGWQGLWQEITNASTNSGLVADNIQSLATSPTRIWVAANGGLSSGALDVTDWKQHVGTAGFAPLGASAKLNSVRLSPDGKWLAVATGDQGVGLYDTQTHNWQTVNKASGLLGDDQIGVVEFDPLGNLWVGTKTGLISLNMGVKATRGPVNLELANESVIDVSFSDSGILALTSDGKVLNLSAKPAPPSWISNAVWNTLIDSTGFIGDASANVSLPDDITLTALTKSALWIVTKQKAIGRYDLKTHAWSAYTPVLPAVTSIRDLLVNDEQAFLATNVGLFRVAADKSNNLTNTPIRKLAAQGSAIWYLGDDGQVAYYDTKENIVRAGGRFGPDSGPLVLADVASFKATPNQLWMAVPSYGVGVYDLDTHGWQGLNNGLPDKADAQQLVDINGAPGALVKVNNQQALYAYVSKTWSRLSAEGQNVTATAQADGGVWYTVSGGGVYLASGHDVTTAYFEGAAPTGVGNAGTANSSSLWINESDGLSRYDRLTHTWTKSPAPFPIAQMAGAGNTTLALGGGKLVTLDNFGTLDKTIFDAPPASGIAKDDTFVSAVRYKDAVWFTTSSGQVFSYNPASHSLLGQALPEKISVLQASSNTLWALGGSALYRYDGTKWQPVAGLSGIPQRIVVFDGVLAVLTNNNLLDWVNDTGAVTAQGTNGFAGLQDVTASAQGANGLVWFASASHGLGAFDTNSHAWITDSSVPAIHTLVALGDSVFTITDTGIVSYSIANNAITKQAELDGKVQSLAAFGSQALALVAEKDGPVLYQRGGPNNWTMLRKPNRIPVDPSTITAVTRSDNRFVLGTNDGKLLDYNAASGNWRTVQDKLPISRVDWIAVSSDSQTIYATGSQGAKHQLISVDAQGSASILSTLDEDVTAAGIAGGRLWYSESTGNVFSVVDRQRTQLDNLLAGSQATAAANTAKSIITEPVRLLTGNGDQLWLATDKAVYELVWNGNAFDLKNRTAINAAPKLLRTDANGVLVALSDNTTIRVENGNASPASTPLDASLLYSDKTWTWQNGGTLKISLAGVAVPFVDRLFGFDNIQTMAATDTDLWLGGAGGTVKLGADGVPVFYAPPFVEGAVQGLRFNGKNWIASVGSAFKQFDGTSWQPATAADYAAPVTVAQIGPAKVLATDKAISFDPPSAVQGSNFAFYSITAIATNEQADNPQLFARTALGVWTTKTPGALDTFSADTSASQQYFSGIKTITLDDTSDGWKWTVAEDRASGKQTLSITLVGNDKVQRSIDANTGAFADDVVLSIANDPNDESILWVGTRGGLWKVNANSLTPIELDAVGKAVDSLQATDADLIVHVDGKAQLFKNGAFSATSDSTQPRVVASDKTLGPLLQQDTNGFTLLNTVDTPRHGFWFDQVSAIADYQQHLWTIMPKGIVSYSESAAGIATDRFDTWQSLGTDASSITRLQTGLLDATQPDSATNPSVLWAADASGKTAYVLQSDKWQAASLDKSPFAASVIRHVPGPIQWSQQGNSLSASLSKRNVQWSNGRFDFDDNHDLATQGSQVWLATAGGPLLIKGTSTCTSNNPVDGLPDVNLDRITINADLRIAVQDDKQNAYTITCSQSQRWTAATSDVNKAEFDPKQAVLNNGQWALQPATNTAPIAVMGLDTTQIFSGNRFSFDVISDTTGSGASTWLASSAGPERINADSSLSLVLNGLKKLDTHHIRAEAKKVHLATDDGAFELNGSKWQPITGVVTDAQSVVFSKAGWKSAPQATPTSALIAVAPLPKDYALFTGSGRFSFDEIHAVVVDSTSTDINTLWLATTGGILKMSLAPDGPHLADFITTGLCGTPDKLRIDNGKLFVGYANSDTGVTLGAACSGQSSWQTTGQVVWGNSTLSLDVSNGSIFGIQNGAPLFGLNQTERVAALFGSSMPISAGKLVAVIDDDKNIWIVFDNNLVILRKDVLQKRI